jgi:hypothetical protein
MAAGEMEMGVTSIWYDEEATPHTKSLGRVKLLKAGS